MRADMIQPDNTRVQPQQRDRWQRKRLRELLMEIELLRRKKVQRFLTEIGLTPGQGQARILEFLSAHEPVTQKELADVCILDVTTMSRVIGKMEETGLLKREKNPECRRSYQIRLTEEGYKKAKEVSEGFETLEAILCGGFSEEELSYMTEKLTRVKQNLYEENVK